MLFITALLLPDQTDTSVTTEVVIPSDFTAVLDLDVVTTLPEGHIVVYSLNPIYSCTSQNNVYPLFNFDIRDGTTLYPIIISYTNPELFFDMNAFCTFHPS